MERARRAASHYDTLLQRRDAAHAEMLDKPREKRLTSADPIDSRRANGREDLGSHTCNPIE